MPFKSKAQMRFMYSQEPKIAAKWEKEYGQTSKGLPEKKIKGSTKAKHNLAQGYRQKEV